MLKKTSNKIIASIAVLLIAVGGYYFAFGKTPANENVNGDRIKVTVYKSPTCSCCLGHVGYLKGQGFDIETFLTICKVVTPRKSVTILLKAMCQ